MQHMPKPTPYTIANLYCMMQHLQGQQKQTDKTVAEFQANQKENEKRIAACEAMHARHKDHYHREDIA